MDELGVTGCICTYQSPVQASTSGFNKSRHRGYTTSMDLHKVEGVLVYIHAVSHCTCEQIHNNMYTYILNIQLCISAVILYGYIQYSIIAHRN